MKAKDLNGISVSFALLLSCAFSVPLAPKAQAQPFLVSDQSIQFEKGKIRIGGKTITVEIADTDQRRQRGLMFRDRLPENEGMLFIFPVQQRLSFWMLNTLIPLSIGYFDQNKKLVDIQEMVPAVVGERSPRTYPSKAPAMYALEMPKGWYKHHDIKEGATFSFVDKQ